MYWCNTSTKKMAFCQCHNCCAPSKYNGTVYMYILLNSVFINGFLKWDWLSVFKSMFFSQNPNSRMMPSDLIETDAILSLDEDTNLNIDEVSTFCCKSVSCIFINHFKFHVIQKNIFKCLFSKGSITLSSTI